MKKALSLAVLLLIGDAAATEVYRHRHGRSYVQFLDGDYEDFSQDYSQDKQSQESLVETEKQMGKQMKTDTDTMNKALDIHNQMHFEQDGETFTKATSLQDNAMVQFPTYYNPVPGVTMIQSDPIHGSLGPKKIDMDDLTPEQQFEEKQRRKKPVVFKDDKDQVDTVDSIKWAEENTGSKFPEYVKKEDMKKPVKYTLHDSDDEDDDTVETRKSVKTAEKALQHRFYINAKEKKDYEKAIAEGKVSQKQILFKEDEDEEFGPIDPTKAFRNAVKKQAKLDAIKEKKEEKTKKKLTKEEKEEKEMADAIAESKKDTPENAPPAPKKDHSHEVEKIEAPPKAPTMSDLPPELAGALEEPAAEKKAAFAQTKAVSHEDSDSDSDSSDSDSD